jgi:type IV fimbrial biogenesis protein FimT
MLDGVVPLQPAGLRAKVARMSVIPNSSAYLTRRKLDGGFSLIEVMVIVAIVAILAAIAAPTFGEYTANTRIRAAAEAFQSDVVLTRNEALKRNQPVTLTYNIGSGVSTVTTTDPCPSSCPITTIRSRDLNDELQITSAPANSVVTFDALGRATTGAFTVTMSKPSKGTCKTVTGGGALRCMNVTITTTGTSRMCDPALTYATNTRGC